MYCCDLYKLILNKLDNNEIAKLTDVFCSVYTAKFYLDNKNRDNYKIVYDYTIVSFLLIALYENWEKELLMDDLKWWFKMSSYNKIGHWEYNKYKGLIETLEELNVKNK